MWTVPAKRMKANREHRVPLCGRALEILDGARDAGKGNQSVSVSQSARRAARGEATAPDAREAQDRGRAPRVSAPAFRDWAAEETNHPREVIEAALAHVVQNRVEAAYRRTDLFDRRRRLMDDWATYLAGQTPEPEAAPSRQ